MARAQETTRSNPTQRGLAQEFRLSTPAFADGGSIPKRYTADGENESPRLSWKEPPLGTLSFALVVEDPDAPSGLFVHWLLWNVPGARRELPERFPVHAQLPDGIRQGYNGFGNTGYGGPSPRRANPIVTCFASTLSTRRSSSKRAPSELSSIGRSTDISWAKGCSPGSTVDCSLAGTPASEASGRALIRDNSQLSE
jgi:Raf kinase inhibitor-like YbhB/YbcL family protein